MVLGFLEWMGVGSVGEGLHTFLEVAELTLEVGSTEREGIKDGLESREIELRAEMLVLESEALGHEVEAVPGADVDSSGMGEVCDSMEDRNH